MKMCSALLCDLFSNCCSPYFTQWGHPSIQLRKGFQKKENAVLSTEHCGVGGYLGGAKLINFLFSILHLPLSQYCWWWQWWSEENGRQAHTMQRRLYLCPMERVGNTNTNTNTNTDKNSNTNTNTRHNGWQGAHNAGAAVSLPNGARVGRAKH